MWSRGLTPVRGFWSSSRCRLSITAQKETAEIDDFLTTLTLSPSAAPSRKQQVLETSSEFCKWLEENPVKSVEQFIVAAQMATTVKSNEHQQVFNEINKVASNVLPAFFDKLNVNELVDSLRFVLQMCRDTKVSEDVQKLFVARGINADKLGSVPYDTLLMIMRYSTEATNPLIWDSVVASLTMRMEAELTKPADLFVLLAGSGYPIPRWFQNPAFIKKTEKLVPAMSIGEKCALLKYMAISRQRSRLLLGALINSICYSGQCLTVSQIVTVTNSCSSLTYYPPKIAKKVSEDLLKNSNVLDNWSVVVSIANSFVKMQNGDPKSWNRIVSWSIENVKQANPDQLSRLVSGLAHIGEPSGKPLANALKPHLKLTKARDPGTWLNIIYSLAYFEELDAYHADSVLNKSFVEQIMSSSTSDFDKIRKAMRLLMINAAVKNDLKDYKGPTVDKEAFARFDIKFDRTTVEKALQLKYSKDKKDVYECFYKSLTKLAPESSHWNSSNVEQCGAFVDAYVMPAQNTALLVNKAEWGTHKPRPVVFYNRMQTKMNVESTGEELITGPEQLALRMLRADGYNPVVVFKSEMEYCQTDTDKVNLLREKVHKK